MMLTCEIVVFCCCTFCFPLRGPPVFLEMDLERGEELALEDLEAADKTPRSRPLCRFFLLSTRRRSNPPADSTTPVPDAAAPSTQPSGSAGTDDPTSQSSPNKEDRFHVHSQVINPDYRRTNAWPIRFYYLPRGSRIVR